MPNTLHQALQEALTLQEVQTVWVAYSGGVDSHVLLHAATSLELSCLKAIHVDHQLHADSAKWRKHCQNVCDQLQVPLQCQTLSLDDMEGESLEAVARKARYQCFSSFMRSGDVLLTAHHQEDQVETLMLQLLRGAGVAGLAAMPHSKPFCYGLHLRPFLSLPKEMIEAYAAQHTLGWVEDPSNASVTLKRNALRHDVFPVLEQHFPGYRKALARVADHMAEAKQLINLSADQAWQQCRRADQLQVEALLGLAPELQKAVIRHWLVQLGFLPPSAAKLEQIIKTVLLAAADKSPCVAWSGVEVRRYDGQLYAIVPLGEHDPTACYVWEGIEPLVIPHLGVTLDREQLALPAGKCEVRFRQGGESLLLANGQHHSLKKYFQEKRVPPWRRDRVPLIYVDGQLLGAAEV